MVSELAALSNRKEYSALDLVVFSSYPTTLHAPTDLAEILRYASAGVRTSADIVAHIGTRFGGFEEFWDVESTSCTVSNEGCMFN